MSTASVHVKVINKADLKLELRLSLIKYDEPEFCTTAACVVQMLWDKAAAPSERPAAIYDAISRDQRLDQAWLRRHQFDFVRTVSVRETFNYPVPPDFNYQKARPE